MAEILGGSSAAPEYGWTEYGRAEYGRADPGMQDRAASYLNTNHGRDALGQAVRHGMAAKQRGDEPATAFWCAVCSLLVHMRQAGNTPAGSTQADSIGEI